MSVKREILEGLANYLDNHPSFSDYKGLHYYYDISVVNANMEHPHFVFNIGYNDDNSEKGGKYGNLWCRSYYNAVEIRFHTVTKDTDVLMEELWDLEEALFRCLNQPNVSWNDIHPNLQNVKYVGTKPLTSMYRQAFRDDYEGEWVCNVLRIEYEIEYVL